VFIVPKQPNLAKARVPKADPPAVQGPGKW
jgi:hypothetical protein